MLLLCSMENSSVIAVGGSDPVHRRERHPSSYYRPLKKISISKNLTHPLRFGQLELIRKEAVNTKYKKTNIRIAPLKSCEPYRVSFENTQQPEGCQGDFHIIYPATVRRVTMKHINTYKDENDGGGKSSADY